LELAGLDGEVVDVILATDVQGSNHIGGLIGLGLYVYWWGIIALFFASVFSPHINACAFQSIDLFHMHKTII
jgi:hypothetical protein